VTVRRKGYRTYQDARQRIARNLARLRREQALTFEILAERSGLHWRHVQKIEHGDLNITILTLCRLADGLSVDIQDLTGPRPER
jgi:transcriptional regulator with XRE-family HTH domain